MQKKSNSTVSLECQKKVSSRKGFDMHSRGASNISRSPPTYRNTLPIWLALELSRSRALSSSLDISSSLSSSLPSSLSCPRAKQGVWISAFSPSLRCALSLSQSLYIYFYVFKKLVFKRREVTSPRQRLSFTFCPLGSTPIPRSSQLG